MDFGELDMLITLEVIMTGNLTLATLSIVCTGY